MSLFAVHKNTKFGVGDKIRVLQKIKEKDRTRTQSFEGIVISIRGKAENKSFTVRRIGAGLVGIERIFPLNTTTIEKITVLKEGTQGLRRSKLYYLRNKSRKELEKIYTRTQRKAKKFVQTKNDY